MAEKDTALLLERLANRLDVLLEKQEEMALDIHSIKEAVYNPDSGVFARVKVLEQQMGTALATITAMFIKDYL